MTVARSSPALRVGGAFALAALVHLSAWQSLAGIRVLLPRPEAPTRTIEATLLPPAQPTAPLPARRAVVRAVSGRHRDLLSGPGPLTAVRVETRQHEAHERPAAVRPSAPVPERRIAPVAAHSAPASAAAPESASVAAVPKPGASAAPTPSAAAPTPSAAAPTPSTPAAPTPSAAAAPVPPAAAGNDVATATPTLPAETAPIPPPRAPASSTSSAPPPAAAAHAAVQVVLPKSARFVYESSGTVRVGGFVLQVRGHTTTHWQFRDGHYKSDLSIDVVSFAQSSQGQFDPEVGLAPDRYVETRRRNVVFTTLFDWPGRHVSFTEDNRQGTAEPGSQDRLSVQFQLSVLRQVYPERFVRGAVMPITLAGTRDVSHWTFTVTGEDMVDSGIGRLRALRVLSNRTTETGDESLEVWISEKLDWFPVRIRIVDKNRNIIDSVLDQATID